MCRSTKNYYTLCVGSEGFSTPYTDFISRFRLSFFTRRGRRPPGRYIYGVPDARPPAPSGAQGHIPHHHHAIEATTSHTQHVKSTCTWHRHATAAAMMRAARVRRRAVDAGCRCMCHRPEGRLSARTDATVTHHTTHTHTRHRPALLLLPREAGPRPSCCRLRLRVPPPVAKWDV